MTQQNDTSPMTVRVTPKKPTVHEALAALIGELPSIGRDDRAPAAMGGYPFRGIEAVTRHVQPLLAKHGLVITPRAHVTQVVPAPGMKEGWQDVYLTVEWTITGPDGSTLTAQTTGIGRDNSDKGANKAQTQAFKYLLLHMLCIADAKDDADGASYEHGAYVEPLAEGWASTEHRDAQWEQLREATEALPEPDQAEVKAAVKAMGFTKFTFTPSHSDAWEQLLPAEAPTEAATSEETGPSGLLVGSVEEGLSAGTAGSSSSDTKDAA